MRDDQPAVVEHVVRDQVRHEIPCGVLELLGLGGQLRQRLGQPVADGDLAAAQRPAQLVLVVAADAERVARRDHAHRQPQHARGVGSAVDEVADEHRAPTVGVVRVDGAADVVAGDHVAEFGKQLLEFGAAAVDVADDVERTGLVAHVVEQRLDDDVRHVDFRRACAARAPGGSPPGAAPAIDRRSSPC